MNSLNLDSSAVAGEALCPRDASSYAKTPTAIARGAFSWAWLWSHVSIRGVRIGVIRSSKSSNDSATRQEAHDGKEQELHTALPLNAISQLLKFTFGGTVVPRLIKKHDDKHQNHKKNPHTPSSALLLLLKLLYSPARYASRLSFTNWVRAFLPAFSATHGGSNLNLSLMEVKRN